MSDLAFAGIAELAPRIATGEVSPVALTALMLERIEAHEPTLNAYITVMANEARADAETAAGEIAAGGIRGPLHGIPIAVKDLFATRGTRTTFGSLLYADWVPDYDATVVERLRAAGAVIIGKTNLHELAFGTTSINAHHGAVRNPWRTDCHPGGSSGGSAAAVAAGLAFGAMGSDTGASIRQPEHCCAIVGLKPTFGRVPKYGALPLSWSMDHVGPMTRSVADAALMLEVLAGHDPRDPGSADKPVEPWSARLASDPKGKRLGIPRAHFFENCEVDVMAAVEAAIGLMADLGAEPVDVALPDMDAALAAGNVIIMAEAHACYRADLERDPSLFSDEVAATLEVAGFYTAEQLLQAQRLRRHLTAETIRAMRGIDALVMPTSPIPATQIDQTTSAQNLARIQNTIPFDLISLPVVSVPYGFTGDGRPVGLQIAGPPFDEAGVLAIAHAYERHAGWHGRRPPGFDE